MGKSRDMAIRDGVKSKFQPIPIQIPEFSVVPTPIQADTGIPKKDPYLPIPIDAYYIIFVTFSTDTDS